ncbi:cytochrome c biogenesis protein CcsA, partial [Streptomyces caeni]
AELGVGLTALAIVLGSLWAKPTWGTWWTWDPRLVTTVVLLLVYIGYLGVRGLAEDPHLNARRAAAVGVLAVVNVPVVHFSVVWWRTLHQPPTVLRPGGPDGALPTIMFVTLIAAVVAFTLAAAWVWMRRVRLLGEQAMPAAPEPGNETERPLVEVVVVPRLEPGGER